MSYETDERVAELTEKLETGIMDLYASDSYAQYISAMAKFHNYSFSNALLILFQRPDASLRPVASMISTMPFVKSPPSEP